MKKIGLILFLSLGSFLIFTGCYHHKADQVYPTCDTSNVRLSVELTAIMSQNCFVCHSSANAAANGGGYNLEDYSTIQAAAIDGRLLSSITQDNKLAPPMPQGGNKLSDCDINKFHAWIIDGAQNN